MYGGVRYARQIRDLQAGADIVVACPGRLEDLIEQGALTLDKVEVAVIDEADEMADMGFLPPVKRLLGQISFDAQIMLFSATLDHGVDEVVETFLSDPKVHSVDSATATVDEMTHHVFKTTQATVTSWCAPSLPARAVAFCSPVPNSRRRSLPRI